MNLIAIKSNEEIYLVQPPFEKVGKIQIFKDIIQITLNDNLLRDEPQPKRERKGKNEPLRPHEPSKTEGELTPLIEN